MKQILKRTGVLESWDIKKIEEVIRKALCSVDSGDYIKLSQELANEVGAKFKWKRIVPQEAVQDAVENILMERGHKQAAKNFILYREKRRIAREIGQSQIDIMGTITDYIGRGDWRIRENSNIQFSFQGLILYLAESTQSRYCLNLYPESIRNAHSQGFLHIHDLGFGLAGYCAGWSLGDLLREGINNVGYCSSNPARNFTTAINHIVNFMGTLQNEWAGAMAFNSIDTYLAPFIRFENLTYRQVYQNIQSLIFNLNTTSRWGGQCCDEITECLALDGWKKYTELKEGELIYTYNLESKTLELKPVEKINVYDYDGDMIYMSGRKVDFLVTPNHKIVRELFNSGEKMVLQNAEDLMSLKTPFNIPLGGVLERNTEFPLSDDEVRLLAWCLSDSHMEKDKDRIRFYQSIIKYHERIRKILDTLGIEYSVQERYSKFSKNVIYQFSVYGDVARKFKELTDRNRNAIPEEFKKQASVRQLRIFINELCYTDGIDKGFNFHKIDDKNPDLRDHDCVIIGRRSEDFIKDLQEIIILAGYSTGVQWKRDSESSHKIVLYQQDKASISKKEYIHYKGKVWCPTTEVGTFIARRDGKVFITGNSPFTNVTLDVVCPKYMRNQPVIIGGELQKETYGEFQKEMDIFNNAFLDVFMKGDRDGRIFSFPIPTYNITKEFPWDTEFGDKLAEMTGKYGVPYFQNFINSDLNPEDVRSMCCRLHLDRREIIKKTGGIFGSGDLTGCYDDETEVLTDNGWKLFKNVDKLRDNILSMDDNKDIEWVPVEESFEYDYEGEIYNFKSNNSDLRVTPNHRMLEISSADNIIVERAYESITKKRFKIPVNNSIKVESELFFKIPELILKNRKYPERKIPYSLWAKFMGIYLSEGSTNSEYNVSGEGNNQGYRISISQNFGDSRNKIIELLKKLPWHFKEEGKNIDIYDKPLWLYLKQFGNRYEKYIPEDLKRQGVSVLNDLWHWLLLGDGTINKGGTEYYWTTSKKLKDDVQEILALMGFRSNSILQKKKDTYIRGRLISKDNQKDCYIISKIRGRISYIKNKNTIKEQYKGKVYCLQVRNNTMLVRRNGKVNWCGNSIGVVTLNLARLGYLAKNKDDFLELVEHYAKVAKNSLEIKRKTLEYNMEHNMFPWTRRYLNHGFKGHFSTIGLVAGHEACLNLLGKGIDSDEGKQLMRVTLNMLKDLTIRFQEETGNLYNLEATPAEGCTYRLAKLDKQHCPGIIQSGEEVPFYTNSTQLPVDSSMDVIGAVMHQSDIQEMYTGGTVFHTFLGESVMDKEVIKKYITKVFSNTRLPYLSITPTFSICPDHGYIRGEHKVCPECGKPVECFSRIVGYYRSITSWNVSKQGEFKERKVFKLNE